VTRYGPDGSVSWISAAVLPEEEPSSKSKSNAPKFQPPHHNDALLLRKGLLLVSSDQSIHAHDLSTGLELPKFRRKCRNELRQLAAPVDASTLTETTLFEEAAREHQAAKKDFRDMLLWWLWPPMGIVATVGWGTNRSKKKEADKTWNQ